MRDAGAALLVQQTWTTGLLTPMGWAYECCHLPLSLLHQSAEMSHGFRGVVPEAACTHPRAILAHFT